MKATWSADLDYPDACELLQLEPLEIQEVTTTTTTATTVSKTMFAGRDDPQIEHVSFIFFVCWWNHYVLELRKMVGLVAAELEEFYGNQG